MSNRNQRRGVYTQVSWSRQDTVASPVAQGGTTAVPRKDGVVVVYVQTDASVEDVTGSHEGQEPAYVRLTVCDGYSKDVVRVYRDAWSGAPFDTPQLAELRRLSAAGDLEALYVCWNDRVSRDPGGLLMLLREFSASGVAVQLVDDPVAPSVPE